MDRLREQFIAFNRACLDSWLIVGNSALSGAERLTMLNADAWRDLMETGAADGQALLQARDMKSIAAKAVEIKPYFDRLAAYTSRAYDIGLSSTDDMNDALETRFAEWHAQARDALDRSAAEMPGADIPGHAAKSILAAGAGMSGWLHRSIKQLLDFARGRSQKRNLPVVRTVETALVPVVSADSKAEAEAASAEPPIVEVFPDRSDAPT